MRKRANSGDVSAGPSWVVMVSATGSTTSPASTAGMSGIARINASAE